MRSMTETQDQEAVSSENPSGNGFLIIVTFLALLELVRQRLVRLFQGEAFGSILMFRAFSVIDGEAPLDL